MGKSAKLHKRPKNLKKASTSTTAAAVVSSSGAQAQAQNSRKKAGLKQKATHKGSESQGHVLGGADYVSLMMGGRKKAKAEAAKLPQDNQ